MESKQAAGFLCSRTLFLTNKKIIHNPGVKYNLNCRALISNGEEKFLSTSELDKKEYYLLSTRETRKVDISNWETKRLWNSADQSAVLRFILESKDPKNDIPKVLEEFSSVMNKLFLRVLIRDLGIASALDKALLVFTWMRHAPRFTPDATCYQSLISAMAENGQVTVARRLFSLMKSEGVDPTPLTTHALSLSLAKKGKVSEALDLLSSLQTDSSKAALHIELIESASKIGQPGLTKDLFTKFYREFGHKVVPVHSGTKSGEEYNESFERKQEVLDTGKKFIYFPQGLLRREDYSKLICACKRVGLVIEAEKVVNSLLLVGEKEEIMDVMNWNAVIGAYLDVGALQEASAHLLRMKTAKILPNAATYSMEFKLLSEMGEISECLNLLKKMGFQGTKPTLENFNTVLSTLSIRCQKNAAYVSKVKEIMKQMELSGIPPNMDTYNHFLMALKLSGSITEAIQVARAVYSPNSVVRPNLDTHYLMLEVYAGERMFNELGRELEMLGVKGAAISESLIAMLTDLYEREGRGQELRDAMVGIGVWRSRNRKYNLDNLELNS